MKEDKIINPFDEIFDFLEMENECDGIGNVTETLGELLPPKEKLWSMWMLLSQMIAM